MFKELKDEKVQLMLNLSKESIKNPIELGLQIKKIDIDEFFQLCLLHELDGVVASHIINNSISELPTYWEKKYIDEKSKLQYFKKKSCEICKIMESNGIKMVILKNGGIMCDMIEDEAACPMDDIDTLVKKDDFIMAHNILLENGYIFQFRSKYEKEELKSAYQNGSTEYYISGPKGKKMWFELSWRAISGRWIRQDLEPNATMLMEQTYCAKGTNVRILSPEDNLLQVCVHTAKHSYVRSPGLRLHLDVERIVGHKSIDWELFVNKVCEAHVKTASYFSLYFAKMLFHTNIPEHVFKRLCPSKIKINLVLKIISKVGLLYPTRKKFTKIQFLTLQTALYDSFADVCYVIFPKNNQLYEKYGYSSPILTPYYLILHLLDLLGVRKNVK